MTPRNVLFLCTGNSARSIMAEAILNAEGGGRFHAFSAGSHPKENPHPLALALLRRQGYDVSGLRSKSWDEFATPDAPALNLVITVCDRAAAEVCPVWPGQPAQAHWSLPDPAAATGDEVARALRFAEVFAMLHRRIGLLLALPMSQLDKLALSRRVDDIGTSSD
ncbi:MAG: arsenate reductase ArsC [Rhodobacteraceae bacterium]|nr:arsenate reductase ArsC [Paracoccaceae bacterium]